MDLQAHHNDDFLTVSELNNFIKDILNSGIPQGLWVCGEIQELRDKKHLYFTLSEKDEDSSTIVAKIGVTIWANVRPKIEAILQKAENSFVLKDDIEVKLLCRVDFYPPFGQLRLIVENIDPTYTLGKIAQDRQRLIALLTKNGVLIKNKQLELPILPLSIGLVTSHESAAYHDFLHELKVSGFSFKILLIDSIMQGKTTEASVVRAIKNLNKIPKLDVIVIIRGGGSIADLSWFDSQLIAETIGDSKIPVISGIGHEINTTITDLAAHTYAKTPTAVAGILIRVVKDFLQRIEKKSDELIELTQKVFVNHRQEIKDQALILRQKSTDAFKGQHDIILKLIENFNRLPISILKESKRQFIQWDSDLKRTIHLRLATSKTKIASYQKLVDMINPQNMIKKGYTITRDSKGRIIKSSKGLRVNSNLNIQYIDGIVISNVQEIKKGNYES